MVRLSCIVLITCAMVSRPTTSAVRNVADLARPSLEPVRSSTTSNGMPNFSASANTARIEKMPTRLAMKFGVSLARTTPLPSVVVRKASRRSRISGCVVAVGISSTRCM
ncbi:hypothetical protein D3C87_1807390 [compost metagenome]